MRHSLVMRNIGLSVLGFLVPVCNSGGLKEEAAEEKAWVVRTQTVEIGAAVTSLTLYGVTESPQTTVLESSFAGDVLATLKPHDKILIAPLPNARAGPPGEDIDIEYNSAYFISGH